MVFMLEGASLGFDVLAGYFGFGCVRLKVWE